MTAPSAEPRARRRAATPAAEPDQRIQPPLGLSPIGEFFRRVAAEHTPGAVQVDQNRQHGAPVLDDTRIPIYGILRELAVGKSWAEIAANYPGVTEARIRAALTFAAAVFWQPQAVDLE